jgi:hypothetical protein
VGFFGKHFGQAGAPHSLGPPIEIGGEARGSTPEEMKAMVTSELQRWTRVVNDAKIPKQ